MIVTIEANNDSQITELVKDIYKLGHYEHFDGITINVILFCPKCKQQHIDAPEPDKLWTNPPHKKHLCHFCGNLWKASSFNTNGVAEIE